VTRATRKADRFEAQGYLEAALEFQEAAEESAGRGRWRAAGLAAIHAAIAAGDAVCVFQLGERSTATSHEDGSDLLRRSRAPSAAERATQLSAVLDLKSKVEYESRAVAEEEARLLVKRSRRLVDWAGEVVR